MYDRERTSERERVRGSDKALRRFPPQHRGKQYPGIRGQLRYWTRARNRIARAGAMFEIRSRRSNRLDQAREVSCIAHIHMYLRMIAFTCSSLL